MVLCASALNYAFSENGKAASGDEGVVPLNASLQIDLKLVSWKTMSDITKDKKVVKNMKKGKITLVTIHPEYAFGSSGSLQELANAIRFIEYDSSFSDEDK
ncbi:hypothetical protein RJT34_13200 [Clitoria ternatea]|uniref:Uncharacterized protein n=1 Tax=Clitoria ternatea TaxID=43366 RepID=A0AAN9PLL4_CLITE